MRLYDYRTQHPNETLVEYEIALRILYREAWPQGDEKMDSSLKRKFEDGRQSPEMVQFLKSHARNDTLPRPWLRPANFKKLMKRLNLGDLPFVGQSYIDLIMRPHPQVSCILYLMDSSEFWRPFCRVKALKLKVMDAAMSSRLDLSLIHI